MPVNDPIGDMLIRIKNALTAKHREVTVPASKMKLRIAEILKEEGYIKDFEFIDDGKQGVIRIILKYDRYGRPVIRDVKRVSKPGRRIYVDKDHIPRPLQGMGISIVSTSMGVMTGKEAKKKGVGGEVVAFIW